jgi:alkylation response protein AidB-like acyl-CoA dehydrogenase
LRDAAAAADASTMLQPTQLALIHRRGWLKMLAPRAYGGAEMPLPQAVRLEEAIAAADGSCGWVVTLCAGAGWFAGFLPPALAQAVVGTRRMCVAGSGAPSGHAEREGDGWRIHGGWGHASGAPIATHFTLNALLSEGGRPVLDAQGQPLMRAFILSSADVDIATTWHGVGLRATASHAFSVPGRWVPASHGFDIEPAAARVSGALYRFPFLTFAFVTLAANLLGMADHFLELARESIGHRLASRAEPRPGAVADTRARLERASETVAGARDRFYGLLDAAWRQVECSAALGSDDARALEAASLRLVRDSRDAVDQLYPDCGLRAADSRSDINRVWRDLHTATQHALWFS